MAEPHDVRFSVTRAVLPTLAGRLFDLVLTDVPYWKMDRAPRSRGSWKRVGEPSRPARGSRLADFGTGGYADKGEWLASMGEIFAGAAAVLKPGGYLVSFIGDMYRDNEYHCLSAELAGALQRIPGLVWKANLVWYDVSKRLHLYGYQYAYIPSLIHQNVLVFRREDGAKGKARPARAGVVAPVARPPPASMFDASRSMH